ncbi:MAG: DMT family transporter [Cellvibrio sp.]|uniref:DMT family transporter n=1 Tax=Cellvibrio sp. TaxID=1965322 RepID=UPI0031B16B81
MNDPQADRPVVAQPVLVQNAFKGFLLAALGLFLFACMDSTTKYLTTHYNVPFVVAMRYIVHFLLMVMILAPRHSTQLIKTQRTSLVVLRAVVLTIASLCMGMALQRMPLAETTAINYLAPTLVALMAGSMLGEHIGRLGWAAIVTGFIGVLLIARPGGGLDAVGIMFALGAAAANATYQLLSRLLASTEKAITLLLYTALIGSIVFGIALPWFWEDTLPSKLELILLISMGVTGGLGHYLFTLAYRHAPASILAPLTYIQLLWAGLLGWIIFDTIPDSMSLLGMSVIAAAGLLVAFKSKLSKSAPVKAETDQL